LCNKALFDLCNVPTTARELEVKEEDVSVTSQLVPLLPPKIVTLAALHIWLWEMMARLMFLRNQN
jgi:hypothetical protein